VTFGARKNSSYTRNGGLMVEEAAHPIWRALIHPTILDSMNNNGLRVVVVTPVRTMEQQSSDHALHVLSSTLGTMLRIEAALWTATRGSGGIPIDEFYTMAKSHEYFRHTERDVNNQTNASSSGLPKCVNKLVDQFTEEEVLLFEFVTVTGWKPVDNRLYSLYDLTLSPKGKVYLNVLQRPDEIATILTRSEILSKMYHLSCKNFTNNITEMNNWVEHAMSVAQMILDHRTSITTTATNKIHDASLIYQTTNNHNNGNASSNGAKKKSVDMTDMNLEERVRARSLINPANSISTQSSKAGPSTQQIESKALLELANSLRSFSQRRGISGRLTVMDLIIDANITWKSVVNDNNSLNDSTGGKNVGGGGSGSGGGINSLVNVDLSRVLFLMRLKMKTCTGITDKRQMETQLIELLQKLVTLVPEWVQLRDTKRLLDSNGSLNEQEKRGVNSRQEKSTIKESIIVIRNDCVDFTEVRAKLGGRVYNLIPDSTTIVDGSNNLTSSSNNGKKRSLFEMRQDQAVVVANARVSDSFRRLYGKALEEHIIDGTEKSPKQELTSQMIHN
jgi:hypothetical protein